MTPAEYILLEAKFQSVLDHSRSLFSQEALDDIQHWIDHGELEMGFESFCLSLTIEGVRLPEELKEVVFELGPALGLDKESVFTGDSWERTVSHLKQS